MSQADALRSEIETARAEMAKTLDALSTRLNPHVQTHRLVHQANRRVDAAYQRARAAAPEPVRDALDRVIEAAAPYARAAAAEPRRTAMIAGGVVAALYVLRRTRRR